MHEQAHAIIRAVEDADNPLLVYELARYAAVSGDRDEAIRLLRRSVVEMEYSGPESLLKDNKLESLRGDPMFEEIVAAARRRVGG